MSALFEILFGNVSVTRLGRKKERKKTTNWKNSGAKDTALYGCDVTTGSEITFIAIKGIFGLHNLRLNEKLL